MRYEIQRRLARGGMGSVYLATDRQSGKHVALKVVEDASGSEALHARFKREVDILRRLDHPGIAGFRDAGEIVIDGTRAPYVAMAYVEGKSLRWHLQHDDLDLARRLEILAEVCDAVHYAHGQGVIHRDLKPENVMIDPAGRAHVLDFGIAALCSADGVPKATLLTAAGDALGTVRYMSPEQVSGERVDSRTDIYSIGVMAYEALVGETPYATPTERAKDLIISIVSRPPVPVSRRAPTLPRDLGVVLDVALAKQRRDRHASAELLAADFRRIRSGRRIGLTSPVHKKHISRNVRAARKGFIFGGCLAVVAGGAAWLAGSSRTASGESFGSALQRLESAKRLVHFEDQTVENLDTAVRLLDEAEGVLATLDEPTHIIHLRKLAAWRRGEAAFIRGWMTLDSADFRTAADSFEKAHYFGFDAATLDAIEPAMARQLVSSHQGPQGHAATNLALSLFGDSKRQTELAIADLEDAERLQSERDGPSHPPGVSDQARARERAMIFNELGSAFAQLGAVTDSVPLFDRAAACFATADSLARSPLDPYRNFAAARASLLYNGARAARLRTERTGDEASLDAAVERLERAVTLRPHGSEPRCRSQIELARVAVMKAARKQRDGGWLDRAHQLLQAVSTTCASRSPLLAAARLEAVIALREARGQRLTSELDRHAAEVDSALGALGLLVPRAELRVARARIAVRSGNEEMSIDDADRVRALLQGAAEHVPEHSHPALHRRIRELRDAVALSPRP